MAKQCGPIFLECTRDDLTFYKMDGLYYVRRKSRLTCEKVLKHKAFAKTRFYAGRLVVASKIASSIYSDLPIDWRQFWMFRDFTGEAITMIDNGATPQEAYNYLWHTYVEYWVLYQQATGIKLKTGRKKQPLKDQRITKPASSTVTAIPNAVVTAASLAATTGTAATTIPLNYWKWNANASTAKSTSPG